MTWFALRGTGQALKTRRKLTIQRCGCDEIQLGAKMTENYANSFCREYDIIEAAMGDYELHCPHCSDVLYSWDDVPVEIDRENVDSVKARHASECPQSAA